MSRQWLKQLIDLKLWRISSVYCHDDKDRRSLYNFEQNHSNIYTLWPRQGEVHLLLCQVSTELTHSTIPSLFTMLFLMFVVCSFSSLPLYHTPYPHSPTPPLLPHIIQHSENQSVRDKSASLTIYIFQAFKRGILWQLIKIRFASDLGHLSGTTNISLSSLKSWSVKD